MIGLGHRVVAVKMAKSVDLHNLGSDVSQLLPERRDLVAEFHLLKNLNHRNIVKLLGACTDQAKPFFLVFEHCKIGSLLKFLHSDRRSRALHPQPHPLQKLLTPREILSFGWQISQAMSYLSHMGVSNSFVSQKKTLVGTN